MCPTMFQLNKFKMLYIILSLAVLNKEVHEIWNRLAAPLQIFKAKVKKKKKKKKKQLLKIGWCFRYLRYRTL